MLHRVVLFGTAFALVLVGMAGVKSFSENIYAAKADSASDIRAAVREAGRSHKNIVLVFGANWCGDCHALEAAMQAPELAPLIHRNYLVVKIDVGEFDKNLGLADRYHVPIKSKGIPALAVLDSNGRVLYSQEQGEFADARHLDAAAFRSFFEHWKPKR